MPGGRPREAVGGRRWVRELVDDPERREAFRACLDSALAGKDPVDGVAAYLRAFEHGYGRPPQALDVRTSEVAPGEQIIYRAAFEDGAPVFAETEAVPEEPTP